MQCYSKYFLIPLPEIRIKPGHPYSCIRGEINRDWDMADCIHPISTLKKPRMALTEIYGVKCYCEQIFRAQKVGQSP